MSNFWKDFSFPSPIDDLLPNPDCTLESLLDVDDVIRDTRSHKQILVDLYVKSSADFLFSTPFGSIVYTGIALDYLALVHIHCELGN